jgi:hypothetical protein
MARKRTELGSTVDAEIRARTARSESAETIASALGTKNVSIRTIRRRQAELRGKTPGRKLGPDRVDAIAGNRPATDNRTDPAGAPDEPEIPNDIPETTPLEDLDRFLGIVNRGLKKAEFDNNLAAIGSLAQKASVLVGLRHRMTPLPKADPNENPDFLKLAAEGEERLLKLVQGLFVNDSS